jgi:ent-kaurene oxidase
MITKYEAISSRKMPLAMQILTRDKTMVATSDYGDEHRMLKKLAVGHLLNINTQVGSNCIYKEVRTVV